MPGTTKTWRDLVKEQNHPDLVPAYSLYHRDIYRDLHNEFGSHFYILSAGWGIIKADFKIPVYNITYSRDPGFPEHAKRIDNYGWEDFNHLQDDVVKFDPDSEIILFAGSSYVPPFRDMTRSIVSFLHRKRIKITIKYKRQTVPQPGDGFKYDYYSTNLNRIWYYKAAEKFLDDHTKGNETRANSSLSPRDAFAFLGLQFPPKNLKELEAAYRAMSRGDLGGKTLKEINDVYVKALEYFNHR
jgi:hypothetical protein